jgi:hypothetical protein
MNTRHQHTPNYYRNRMTEYLTQGQRMFSLKYYCWQRSFTDLSLNQTPFHVTIKKNISMNERTLCLPGYVC